MQAARVHLLHQPVEVGQAAITRVDSAVIADVIAEVLVGAGIDGGEPQLSRVGFQRPRFGDKDSQRNRTLADESSQDRDQSARKATEHTRLG